MSVQNGQRANENTFNNSFLDKNKDTETTNNIALKDPTKGADVESAQESINKLYDTIGTTELDANAKIYTTNNFITDGENRKQAVEALDAGLKITDDKANTNAGNLVTHEANYLAHKEVDTLTNLGTWASTAPNGAQAFATDTKQAYQAIDGSLEPIGGSGLSYMGTWDADTNTPALPTGTENSGEFYKVSVAGTQDLGNGAETFAVGDWAIYSDGYGYERLDAGDSVLSVNGYNGTVVLDADDIAETTTRFYDVKNNRDATTNPDAANDNTEGYSIGSTWFNKTTGNKYILKDATTGAAVWTPIGGSAGLKSLWGLIEWANIDEATVTEIGGGSYFEAGSGGGLDGSSGISLLMSTDGDGVEFEKEMPKAAKYAGYNVTTLSYRLAGTEIVKLEVLDWNDVVLNSIDLQPTIDSGIGPFKTVKIDYSFPNEFTSDYTVKFRFTRPVGAGNILGVNFIQSDYDPRATGEYMESQALYIETTEATFGSTNTGVLSVSDLLSSGEGLLDEVTTASDGTYLEAKKRVSVNISAGFICSTNGATAYITLNDTALTASVHAVGDYIGKSTVYSGAPYGELNANIEMNAGDKLRIQRGTAVAYTFDALTITATANHRTITQEVESVDRNRNFVTIDMSNGHILNSMGGVKSNFETNDGLTTALTVTGAVTLNYSTMGATVPPAITTGNGYTTGERMNRLVNFREDDITKDEVYLRNMQSDGVSLRGNIVTIFIEKVFPDRANLKESVNITLNDIRPDGQEYPVFGEIIHVGGQRFQVMQRWYKVTASEVLSAVDVGLVVLNSDADEPVYGEIYFNRNTNNGGSLGHSQMIYKPPTGSLEYATNQYGILEKIKPFYYYDPDKPL